MRCESHIAHTVRVLLQALSFEHANTKRLNAENDSLPVRLIRSKNTIAFTEYYNTYYIQISGYCQPKINIFCVSIKILALIGAHKYAYKGTV